MPPGAGLLSDGSFGACSTASPLGPLPDSLPKPRAPRGLGREERPLCFFRRVYAALRETENVVFDGYILPKQRFGPNHAMWLLQLALPFALLSVPNGLLVLIDARDPVQPGPQAEAVSLYWNRSLRKRQHRLRTHQHRAQRHQRQAQRLQRQAQRHQRRLSQQALLRARKCLRPAW